MADRKKFKVLAPKKKELPPVEHKVLSERRVTIKKLPRYLDRLLAAFAPYLLPETLNQLRIAVADGDSRAVENVLKIYGLRKDGAGVTIQQNNASISAQEQPGGHRSLDSFLRELAVRNGNVVDVVPEKAAECLPSSSPSLQGS